jgi:hypothetical protein
VFQFYKEALQLLIMDMWYKITPHVCTKFSVSYIMNTRKCLECNRVDLNTPPLKFDIKHGDN